MQILQCFLPNASSTLKNDSGFIDANKKRAINGLMYGNLLGLNMSIGERVRWYVASMGDIEDMHTPHWHAQTTSQFGIRTDVLSLLPAQMTETDMIPDDPGYWMFHCHVNSHNYDGMNTKYLVSTLPIVPPPTTGTTALTTGITITTGTTGTSTSTGSVTSTGNPSSTSESIQSQSSGKTYFGFSPLYFGLIIAAIIVALLAIILTIVILVLKRNKKDKEVGGFF